MFRTFDSFDEQAAREVKEGEQTSEIAEMADNNTSVDFPALINRMNGFQEQLDKIMSIVSPAPFPSENSGTEQEDNSPINGIEDNKESDET